MGEGELTIGRVRCIEYTHSYTVLPHAHPTHTHTHTDAKQTRVRTHTGIPAQIGASLPHARARRDGSHTQTHTTESRPPGSRHASPPGPLPPPPPHPPNHAPTNHTEAPCAPHLKGMGCESEVGNTLKFSSPCSSVDM